MTTPPYRRLVAALVRWHYNRRHIVFIDCPPRKAGNVCGHHLWMRLAEFGWDMPATSAPSEET